MTSRTGHGDAPDVAPPDGDPPDGTASGDPGAATATAPPAAGGQIASGDRQVADAAARQRRGRRAEAIAAVGLITAIAVVAAAATIIWARLSAAGAEGTTATPVPEALADGRTPPAAPEAVAAATGLPVVVAERLDDPGGMAAGCGLEETETLGAFVTPDHALVLAITGSPPLDAEFMAEVESPGPVYVTCVSTRAGDGWRRTGLAAVPRDRSAAHTPAWLCCDASGRATVHHVLQVHDGAAWLLQDNATHAVAYDVTGLDAAGVASTERGDGTTATAHVWWLDGEGAIVGEAYLGG